MITLLHSSVIIGLLRHEHVNRPAVEAWFGDLSDRFAACPITQGLAQLARQRQGRVATLDRGFAALHSDVTDLVPVG